MKMIVSKSLVEKIVLSKSFRSSRGRCRLATWQPGQQAEAPSIIICVRDPFRPSKQKKTIFYAWYGTIFICNRFSKNNRCKRVTKFTSMHWMVPRHSDFLWVPLERRVRGENIDLINHFFFLFRVCRTHIWTGPTAQQPNVNPLLMFGNVLIYLHRVIL